MLADTIAAIATPLGEGGLALVRVSGPRALAVADAIFRPWAISPQTIRRSLPHAPLRPRSSPRPNRG